MEHDCCLVQGNKWFRYRAAAIIVENDCVLFAGNAMEDYYYSIGGGVHIGESAEDAVLREVWEETGVHYAIDRLAVIHENFFVGKGGSLDGLDCHEVALYFLMKPRNSQILGKTGTTAFGVNENTYWLPIQELHRYKAFPSFMQEYLQSPRDGVVHIVTDDRTRH